MSCLSGVTFVLFRFHLYAFIEAAALRSIVLRYACAPTATRSYGDVAFSEHFCIIAVCKESTSYVLSFRIVFFYLMIARWIFYHQLM